MDIKSILLYALIFFAFLISFPAVSISEDDSIRYDKQNVQVNNNSHEISIIKGYSFKVLNTHLKQPRIIFKAANNSLYIGSKSGEVYQLEPPYKNEKVIARVSDYPHSVVVKDNTILIARTSGVYKANLEKGSVINDKDLELIARLPSGPGHSSRTIKYGPDGELYLSLGISGNCSNEFLSTDYPFEKRRGGIITIYPDKPTKDRVQIFTSGLRNPIGFDWHPETGHLYFTNNGPDHLGYGQPPEYFSKASKGDYFGMPWFQYTGTKIIRDECIQVDPPLPKEKISLPEATFPSRSAPMDMLFISKNHPDARLKTNAIVAIHGSWATRPFGTSLGLPSTRREPRIVMVKFDRGKAQDVVDLVTGFQTSVGNRWCRPMGLSQVNGKDIVFTCDAGNEGLYMLEYTGK